MTTWQHRMTDAINDSSAVVPKHGIERRQYRRHDLDQRELHVERHEPGRPGPVLGKIVDLSAGGVRIRTTQKGIRPDWQVRVRIELPDYAGICPFVERTADGMRPKREWVGWLAVSRVNEIDDEHCDVAGRLVDMDDVDRGMLGLYLSTQPLAA
jgi:hypothetical protein